MSTQSSSENSYRRDIDTDEDAKIITEEMTSMYEKVCVTLTSNAEINIENAIDLYTLYSFVSFFLCIWLSKIDNFQSEKKYTKQLGNIIKDTTPDQVESFFFESDKMQKKINLERAILISNFTEAQKNLFKRKIEEMESRNSIRSNSIQPTHLTATQYV
jgi:hypothetical protein